MQRLRFKHTKNNKKINKKHKKHGDKTKRYDDDSWSIVIRGLISFALACMGLLIYALSLGIGLIWSLGINTFVGGMTASDGCRTECFPETIDSNTFISTTLFLGSG